MKPIERGQGLIEYALLISLIAISTILAFQVMGISLASVFCDVAAAINLQSICSPKAICEDSFDSLEGWNTFYGKPHINTGQLCLNKGNQLYNACSMSANSNNYTIRLENAYLYQGNGYGVFFRTTFNKKGANGYIFQYDPGLNAFVIRMWINGKEIVKPIAKTLIPQGYPIYNTPHDVEITVQDNTFTVFLDGEKILEATDETYKEGGIGLRTWDSTEFCADQFTLLSNP
ncbi:MAG: hypothetical protein Kow0088_12440 [Anaerolineales bacterium]